VQHPQADQAAPAGDDDEPGDDVGRLQTKIMGLDRNIAAIHSGLEMEKQLRALGASSGDYFHGEPAEPGEPEPEERLEGV
jgi:hypothetical protein